MGKEKAKKRYRIELTEEQMKVTQNALEEYFRLRMGQEFDFCTELAEINTDLSPEKPEHDRIFNLYIARRDHMQELMRAFFRIAYEPYGYLKEKTDDMMIAETIWDTMRWARGLSRWDEPLRVGSEPCPKIETLEEN